MFTSGIIAVICAIVTAGIKAYLGKDKSVTDVQTILKEERNEAEAMQAPVPDKKTVISDLP